MTGVQTWLFRSASCDFVITFPDGGSIEATQALTITFGAGGALNLGATGTVNTNPQPISLDYSAGGSLVLAPGESITFDDNGSMLLGTGGNIDYTDIVFISTGGANLTAVSGTKSIVIEKIVINGGLNITLNAEIVSNNGSIEINASALSLVSDTAAITPSYCAIASSGSLILTNSTPIVTTDTCTGIAGTFNISPVIITGSTINQNSTLIVSSGTFVLTPTVVSAGPLQLQPLTQQFVSSLPDGTELPTDDGNNCTVSAGD